MGRSSQSFLQGAARNVQQMRAPCDFCDLPKPIKRYPPPPHPLKGRRPSTEPHAFFQRPLVCLNLPSRLTERTQQQVVVTHARADMIFFFRFIIIRIIIILNL